MEIPKNWKRIDERLFNALWNTYGERTVHLAVAQTEGRLRDVMPYGSPFLIALRKKHVANPKNWLRGDPSPNWGLWLGSMLLELDEIMDVPDYFEFRQNLFLATGHV